MIVLAWLLIVARACPPDLMATGGYIQEPCDKVGRVMSNWTSWNPCSATCGNSQRGGPRESQQHPQGGGTGSEGGRQQRHRQIARDSRAGGKACPSDPPKTRGHDQEQYNEGDCVVNDRTDWDPRSATGGDGRSGRSRKVPQQPQDGGAGCGLELAQLGACPAKPCEYVDRLWDDWADWIDHSCSRDGGQRTRARRTASQPGRSGKPREPSSKEEGGVGNMEIRGRSREPYNSYGLELSQLEVRPAKPCEYVDCLGSDWADWIDRGCSCDGVQRARTHRIRTRASSRTPPPW